MGYGNRISYSALLFTDPTRVEGREAEVVVVDEFDNETEPAALGVKVTAEKDELITHAIRTLADLGWAVSGPWKQRRSFLEATVLKAGGR